MREVHYTFVFKTPHEDELLEGEFEDGLSNILETAGYMENPDETEFDIDLVKNVVSAGSSEERP